MKVMFREFASGPIATEVTYREEGSYNISLPNGETRTFELAGHFEEEDPESLNRWHAFEHAVVDAYAAKKKVYTVPGGEVLAYWLRPEDAMGGYTVVAYAKRNNRMVMVYKDFNSRRLGSVVKEHARYCELRALAAA